MLHRAAFGVMARVTAVSAAARPLGVVLVWAAEMLPGALVCQHPHQPAEGDWLIHALAAPILLWLLRSGSLHLGGAAALGSGMQGPEHPLVCAVPSRDYRGT